jgi:hypothetical protein
MAGRVKLGGYKGGRGYNGWHKNWMNEWVYLRSKLEYIYARYLDIKRIPYKLEQQIYEVNGITYKPDFFLYEDISMNELNSIVEIKDTCKEKNDYVFTFKSFFESIGIKYLVFYQKDLKKIKKDYKIDVDAWVDRCIAQNPSVDMKGHKNPAYGTRRSNEFKMKRREESLLRFSSFEKRAEHSYSIKEGFTPEIRKQLSEQKKRESRKKYPTESKKCSICSNTFYIKKNTKQESRKTCSRECEYKLNQKEGKHNYATKQALKHRTPKKLISLGLIIMHQYKDTINKYKWDKIIKDAKEKGYIHKNNGLSLQTIEKYFGTFEVYKKELMNASKS